MLTEGNRLAVAVGGQVADGQDGDGGISMRQPCLPNLPLVHFRFFGATIDRTASQSNSTNSFAGSSLRCY
jgi:hypothetical protein